MKGATTPQPSPRAAERVGIDRPLYLAVKEEISRLISQDIYPSGSQLASEPELARQLGVSRVVLREALRTLEEEGVLMKRPGIGTFVNSPYPVIESSLTANLGLTEIIEGAGFTAGTSSLTVTDEHADPHTAELLGRPAATPVLRIERVRTADGRPVAFTVDRLPLDVCRSRCQELEQGTSLYELLATWGVPVGSGYATLTPAKAGDHVAKALGISPESVVLLIEQADSDDRGAPVLVSEEYHVRTAFRFSVHRLRPRIHLSDQQ